MTDKQDVYSRVTDKILADLSKGELTWRRPWQAVHAAGSISMPLRAKGERYKGINVLMLWATALERGYVAPIYMTFNQAHQFGGHVRKGEKGSLVVFAKTFTKTQRDENGEDIEKEIPFMRGYTVFNVEQIEGLPPRFYAVIKPQHRTPLELNIKCDAFIASTDADIRHGGNQAFYSLSEDFVRIPHLDHFIDEEKYYATTAHELCHWTRHPKRLNRDLGRKRWGDAGYAMEELVAEIGSAFLCAELGITPETREDHAAYIASWMQVLKKDNRAIFTAAAHAQRAVDFLNAFQAPPVWRDPAIKALAIG
jgi:antirestriction protein ArdC